MDRGMRRALVKMCLPRMRYAFAIFDLLLFHMDTDLEQLSELMRRYASGDDSAFESLYHGLAPRLYRFCLRLAPRRSDADDLLQETFLRLPRSRATYRGGANVLH